MIIRKLKEAIHDVVKEREKKKKQKELLKRRSRKYGQKRRVHAKRGVASCLTAGLTLFFLILIFSAAYISRDESGILLGFMGIGTLLMSISGFRKALEGFEEREKDYLTCKIGVGVNGTFIVALVLIFIRGLF